jgi:hypothetical protein
MNRFDFRIPLGIGLIVVGALYLLQTFGVIATPISVAWILLFAAAGVVFLYFYLQNREHWWAIIPGITMLGLAGLIFFEEYAPSGLEEIGPALFLGSIGLSFVFVYFTQRSFWWAIIPAGILLSLAAMLGLEPFIGDDEALVGVFFLGGGLTFAVIGLLPAPGGSMRWAFIPAGIFVVMGIFFFSAAIEATQMIWAGGLVLLGVYILARNFLKGGDAEQP